jgi:hypothetical protein
MELSKPQKIATVFFFIGLLIWIGGSIVRTAIAYDIYEPVEQTLKLRFWVDDKIALLTARHYAVGSLYTEIGFLLSFFAFLYLVPKFKTHFKREGWLFMSFILFLLASISEFILFYFDLRLNLYLFFEQNVSFNSPQIQNFFFKRLTKFNFLIVYNWLAIFTIIIFLVFRPLRKKNEAQSIN